jgi:hypothetical protein
MQASETALAGIMPFPAKIVDISVNTMDERETVDDYVDS